MNHFYQGIQGWFDWENIYKAVVELAPMDTPSTFVELGAWKGRSSAFLATEIVNSNKPITLYIVDAWDGRGHTNPDGTPEYNDWQADIQAGLFNTFTINMIPVKDHYNAIQSDIAAAAEQFENESLDFVWLDTSMDYDLVKAELRAWIPKVRTGGYIGGHDFFSSPNGVGRLVVEEFGNYRTNGQSWYARIQPDGDTSDIDKKLAESGKFFSQAIGPEQSNAYLRGKYAALSGSTVAPSPQGDPTTNAVPDRPEYLRSKYAVKF